ncbi:hypothetical protein CCACVL1_09783 [Corchorus capsularis]|uniref:Uncharacterized protein n=1 Tax=Corchorus capsularis TaxID=210143 RepID=A0A1R3IU61_COCAP|nr:hypothetical protein CCACVL1_09783 [Corchorus capsularis]
MEFGTWHHISTNRISSKLRSPAARARRLVQVTSFVVDSGLGFLFFLFIIGRISRSSLGFAGFWCVTQFTVPP